MAESKGSFIGDGQPINPPPYSPGFPPGAYPDPQEAHFQPQGTYPQPQGTYPQPHGAYPYPAGAYPSPAGAHHQQFGPHDPYMNQGTAPPVVVPVVMAQQVGPQPTRITCPTCQKQITTRIDSSPNSKTHLAALLLFVFGCWCCCCIPYCVDSCLSIEHYCPSCNTFLGTYQNS